MTDRMTLRDQFAMTAFARLLEQDDRFRAANRKAGLEGIGRDAYTIADAAMAARARSTPDGEG